MIVRKLPLLMKFCLYYFIYLCLLSVSNAGDTKRIGEIIYAINCGGGAHTDINGVHYKEDPLLHTKVGISSDYGRRYIMGRIHEKDQILYQTERYSSNTFGYDLPGDQDGEFVLVLKFSEVYFTEPEKKVFDVVLNGDHTIITDLDIYDRVGRAVAHDEYIPFSINKGRLYINGEESEIQNGKIRVEFIKGYKDNPKINAIYIMRGALEDVPKLPPLEAEPIEEEREEYETIPKNIRPGEPKQPDPYSLDDSSMMLPVFIAIGTFIPVLFCLCKL